MENETAFVMKMSNIKYGPGVTREVGFDMRTLGAKHVMVVADPNLVNLSPVNITLEALEDQGIETHLFENVSIEPTDLSFKEAIKFAAGGKFDGYVAVGGGSTIDTAKIANLYATYPSDFRVYVNPPIGAGQPVPGPLAPLIAIPTTAGTGSETTGVAIFDFKEYNAKTGISHSELRPVLGIVDPDNTRTLPKMVAACTGWDVLCHALESLTAIPYNKRESPKHPGLRPPYQGANPISDIWASKAIMMVAQNIVRVLEDPSDDEARGQMLLAACFAGIGFGNAGVHLPHGMSYPVSGMVRNYFPEGYQTDHPIIPHGMAVILNAPAVFRFTGPSDPERHLYAAELMGADISDTNSGQAGELLANKIIELMQRTGIPNGLQAVGFSVDDVDQLVDGTLLQHRINKLSPRQADAEVLGRLFREAMIYW
ncbi:MAG: iron-containing alcohol dehydrogenase [Anaerolineales bacterium]|nr:iron-containing alcohol dehydrogenase [Anaerolineales bacterium]